MSLISQQPMLVQTFPRLTAFPDSNAGYVEYMVSGYRSDVDAISTGDSENAMESDG
jgi:hypothetical protein